jgi:hypothetical protein
MSYFSHVAGVHRKLVIVQRDRLLNPENQTTKSPRHEEVKGQVSFFFVSLCLRGSFLIPRGERLPLKDVFRRTRQWCADSLFLNTSQNGSQLFSRKVPKQNPTPSLTEATVTDNLAIVKRRPESVRRSETREIAQNRCEHFRQEFFASRTILRVPCLPSRSSFDLA